MNRLPFGEIVTAGIECIVGSAIYLKSTGMSLWSNKTNKSVNFDLPKSFKTNLINYKGFVVATKSNVAENDVVESSID